MKKTSIKKIRRKTFINIARAFEELTDKFRVWTGSISPNLSNNSDLIALNEKIYECVNTLGGEINARQNAVALGNLYLSLSDKGKINFIHELIANFDINKQDLFKQMQLYLNNINDSNNEFKLRASLIESLKSPMLHVFHRFISIPDGLKFIINMRADLLKIPHNKKLTKPAESTLKSLLSVWFDADLLNLTQITWDSPASLLEKLIKYEAVHRISSWDDLKNRLDSDRRCFAFFHSKMPDEPLIFVEVALVHEISSSIHEILDEEIPPADSDEAKVAVFYSISNTQIGLAGINLGNFLIKRVVQKLSQEFPRVLTYITLSPIPQFTNWLQKTSNLDNKEYLLKIALDHTNLLNHKDDKTFTKKMLEACAIYLKSKHSEFSRVIDPVEHFHLSNGAYVKRINWMADQSTNGLSSSAGMMVNYHYNTSKINKNCENYSKTGEAFLSKKVLSLIEN